MRKPLLVVAIASWFVAVTGCDKLKSLTGGGDAGEDATVDAAVTPAPVETASAAVADPPAKNAADIARFPAETKLGNAADKILALSAAARTVPRAGALVATLKSGTDVVKIAEHQDAVLVAFPDPKDPAEHLEGWVTKDAFVAPAVPAPVVDGGAVVADAGVKDAAVDAAVAVVDAGKASGPACAAGQEAVNGFGKDPVCKKKCAADKDCKNASAGSCAVASTAMGKVTRVCTND